MALVNESPWSPKLSIHVIPLKSNTIKSWIIKYECIMALFVASCCHLIALSHQLPFYSMDLFILAIPSHFNESISTISANAMAEGISIIPQPITFQKNLSIHCELSIDSHNALYQNQWTLSQFFNLFLESISTK